MHTEEEAKNLWCPHAPRLGGCSKKASLNRDHKDFPQTPCIASQCMAWRWVWHPAVVEEHNRTASPSNQGRANGDCGLAGEP